MRRVVLALVVLAVAGALVMGLRPVSPARTFDDYQHKAEDTAESVLSSVQTARLAARLGTRGDAFGPFVSVVLSESDKGVAKAQGVFDGVQPPDRHADRLRDELGKLLGRASDGVAKLRISARRSELAGLDAAAQPLARLARQLRRFITANG